MIRTIAAAALAATLALPALAQNAEVLGTWRTQPDDNGNYGLVDISVCGDAYCGVLVRSFDGAGNELDSPNTGRQIIWDMRPYGNGHYDDGQIYAPDRDSTYASEMDLAGNTLTVRGCFIGICRAQTWTRN
ncbi:Uncharacterized conserved protein, DUF2147 family [Wenxinia saemankumensis]|uniref:Uncharacterized conserved protein, DUF2147 family n=2 Tax=Wenxinia saemankumensis TaxID=1447782 RepID=A0A1M6GRM4_9RHOB|nr:Uncharacterized conserved protein, DUF2147 family [Wenxinia saemankumensis]